MCSNSPCALPDLPARGAAVLTESGAFKALTLDLCEQVRSRSAADRRCKRPLLRAALPSFVPASNPVDLTAQALVDPDLYRRALSALLQDDRFGSIIFGIIQTDPKTCQLKFPAIIAAVAQLKPKKPVIFAGLDEGAEVPAEFIAAVARTQCAVLSLAPTAPIGQWRTGAGRLIAIRPSVRRHRSGCVRRPPRGIVAEYRAKALLAPLGIRFPEGRLVKTLADAQAIAAQIGMPGGIESSVERSSA